MRRDQAHGLAGAATFEASADIRLFGPFAVYRRGERLPDHRIGSRKARTLLKRLLVERDRVVGTYALAEVVWPEDPPEQPDRHLATLVSRLRANLGSGAIVREGNGYRFGDGYVTDVDQVEQLVAEAEQRLARAEPGLAYSAAERALKLLERGELLADEPDADWATLARSAAAMLLRRARRCAWNAALALRRWDDAVRLAETSLAAEPFDEEACRALMRARRACGEPGLALAAYEKLRAALATELGTDPSADTRTLHLEILRGTPGDAVRSAAGVASVPGATAVRDEHELVGRRVELDGLRLSWSRAAAGTGGLVLLAGEAGIGKTSLAGEVVRLAEITGGMVARARCYETERSLFLQPVAEALRPLVTSSSPELVREAAGAAAGSLATLIAEVGVVAPAVEHRQANPELERRRLFDAVASFVRSLAARQPLLLFLDDLHLAGPSTIEFLHYLVRRVSDARVLVLATLRVEEGSEVLDILGGLAQRWDLGPLPEDAVRELAGRSGLADLTSQIMARTRGHSLFVVETLRAVAEQPEGPAGTTVPESLRAAVLARLRRAGRHVEELVRVAATLGGSLDPTLLAALMDTPVAETVRTTEAACRARLLHEAGSAYEFANDLIQEIAYQSTPLPTRIARHRRAAELLAGSPEAVAAHAARAGDWPAAVEAYLQAADAATGRYANREAARLLEQALAAAHRIGDPVGVARATLARGRIREALTDYQGAHDDHVAVVELARAQGRPDLELAALRELGGDLLVGTRRPIRECVFYLESALALAETTGEVAGHVDILGRLAVIWTNRLRFDLAASHAQRALDLAEPRYDAAVQAVALDAVKSTLAYRGDLTALEEVLPRLEACLRRHPYSLPRTWAAFESALPALARARWSAAAAQIEHAVAMSRETGYVAYQAPFLAHLAWVERARGDYASALSLGTRAVDLAEDTGHPWWVALASAVLGWALTEVGAVDEAVTRLERGLAVAERDGTEGYLVRCLGHLAWASALRGEHERAASLAYRAEAVLAAATGGPGLHVAPASLATAAARIACGDPGAAARLVTPVRDAATAAGWVELSAWADLLLARCRASDEPRQAGELARAALAAARDGELPAIAWQAHGLLAGLPGADADAHRASARSIIDELAGSVDDPDRRAAFRTHAAATLTAILQSCGPQEGH